ncbi:MAG: glutamate synthase subunit alpha [Spirochaetes bacterium]|nr:glutamate synthase subunit alpha [Spirochaetota bacterium]
MQKREGLFNPQHQHDACGVGFVVRIDGTRSHKIVEEGVEILCNLEHRGAVGGDMKTGDGAGMLLQIPHDFFKKKVDFDLPEAGKYGVGFLFLPQKKAEAELAQRMVEHVLTEEGLSLLGWRDVPVNPDTLGEQARREMPVFKQVFIIPDGAEKEDNNAFERKLYIVRKCLEREAVNSGWDFSDFYIPSFSCRTIVYKGMFVSTQFVSFYTDLQDEDFVSALALVHQRYSTNTFPSWFLAQPFRLMAHNGEINTLRGNLNKMKAREKTLTSGLFKDEISKLFPVTDARLSDSAIFDNVLELLAVGGRSLEHSLMMMIPEAFGSRFHISQDKRAFFEYHAAIMEPWDGPAAISFSDGVKVGAMLDRNGLRPGRYVITKSGKVVLASETGVLDFKPEDILEKGRLAPGKMFIVDTGKKRIIKDNEIKSSISRRKPYRHWLEKNRILLKGLLGVPRKLAIDKDRLKRIQRAFGYTLEDLRKIIAPMAENSKEPIGSMGNDTALAVLSKKPQLLFNYFKQLFAQVTNPPIDPYRENLVMSLMSFVGKERNLLDESPEHCRQLKLSHPILTNDDIETLKNSAVGDLRVCTVPMLFATTGHLGSLKRALNTLCREVESKIDEGYSIVILSDRGISEDRAAVPSLLAVSAVHHYLVRKGKRHLAGLILETGEAREVHHFAALIGFGASGINPYLAFESVIDLKTEGYIADNITEQDAVENYITALKKGLLKIMSKMGVTTIRSYRGAQIFEAVGLNEKFVDEYFSGTPTLIGGIGINTVEKEKLAIHKGGFPVSGDIHKHLRSPHSGLRTGTDVNYNSFTVISKNMLDSGGLYNYRRSSAEHRFSPEAITLLQKAVWEEDYETFKKYTGVVNNAAENLCTLRGILRIKKNTPVPIEEVEPVESIVKRFVASAMSFGSIGRETHETIALAMNSLGTKSNSGEGGEDEYRFKMKRKGVSLNSKIKQVASARFGVTSNYLVNAEELQIKISQGAKPGEGGQLPGHKVSEVIARVRHSTPGVMLISPPPHHDIYSIEDLAQLIFDLKHGNPDAKVSVKLVSEVGVGTVAAGVAKGKADTVLISGGDGGTGASPLSSIMHTGTPWEIGLSETHQVLVKSNLRDRIKVQVDGQVKTGRDIIIAALLGAEEFGFATTLLVTLGCVMMRKCHLNTCPVGVATQDPALRKYFHGKPQYVVNFMRFLAGEVREYMAEMGFRKFEELIGRVDLLEKNPDKDHIDHEKAEGLDFSGILYMQKTDREEARHCVRGQENNYPASPDEEILKNSEKAVKRKEPVSVEMGIRNSNRAVGAMLSSVISKRYGSDGLPEDTIHVKFKGSAGQSFGAFLAPGVTFELEGDANDYFCKGMSGGRAIVYPPEGSNFIPERNIITGNVNLFGATSGEVFIKGMAGERFCVRNSGAIAVVEGVGDHGCEYMTGGCVLILGETGVNFAAGMSGGIAYVLDKNQLFDTRCNLEMVDVEHIVEDEDKAFIRKYIEKHAEYTKSRNAIQILNMWEEILPLFVKVIPLEYREALSRIKETEANSSKTVSVTEEVHA